MSEELLIPNVQASTLPDRQVRIAREIAMNIREIPEILEVHAITPEEFAVMKADPRFDELLRALLLEWNGAKNTAQRVQVKAATSLEESLMNLHISMNNPNEPLNHRVEAFKFVAKMAGIGEQEKAAGTGGFSVTINIGGDHKPKVIEGRAEPQMIEG